MSLAGAGAGAGLSPTSSWDPTRLWGVSAGFWADLDAPNAVVRNTQPGDFGGDMSSAVGWIVGAGWEIAGGVATCDGTATASVNRSALLAGNRYVAGYDVTARTSGGVYFRLGTTTYGDQRIAANSYTEERTVPATGVIGFYSGTGFVGSCDNVAATNLSIASITCKGTLGNLAQSTAANMGWSTALGSRNGVYCAADDGFVLGASKATQRHFHDGSGVTAAVVYYPDALAATRTVVSSANAATDSGFEITVATNGAITYSVFNTAPGTPYLTCTSSAGIIVAGAKARIDWSMSTAGVEVYVDGVLVASDYVVAGSPSAGDATNLVKVGNLAAAYTAGAAGQLADVFSVARVISSGERSKMQAFFAGRHA